MIHDVTSKLVDEPGRLAALQRYDILDTSPESEFDRIVSLVRTIFDAPMAFVSLIDAERQWLKAASGVPRGETPRSLTFCDHTIRSKAPLAVGDASQDLRFATNPFVVADGGIRCYLGAPLSTPDGYNVGTLCIVGTEARTFTEKDGQILAAFAQLVVSQLELRMLASRDGLTGVLTRRAFEELLRRTAQATQDGATKASLLLIDIDHFKFVNDRFGHPAGDQVLKAVVGVIEASLRPSDRLGRLGGEEFAVLMTDSSPDGALALAERIRQAVADQELTSLDRHRVTISAGLATWRPDFQTADEWTAAADIALYAAKRAGRNRIMISGQSTLAPGVAIKPAA